MRAGADPPATARPTPPATRSTRPIARSTPPIARSARPTARRTPPTSRRTLLALPVLLTGCLVGCTAEAAPTPPEEPPPTVAPSHTDARAELAALAAAAQDRHLIASYTLSTVDRPDRTVLVTAAQDGTWRVDIPGGALGGTADVSVAQTAGGIFQCSLPSASRPEPPGCVRVADPGGRLPAAVDPRVQHPFTDWREVLTDRRAPLSVSVGKPLPGAGGRCFAVDSTLASLSPPLDVGIYCYRPDGTLTGARLAYGTLVLAGAPAAGPATVALPGPVVPREPLGMNAPPPPPTTTAAVPDGSPPADGSPPTGTAGNGGAAAPG